MIKLSVIIPIYKVENYIIECLESICCQLVEGVEVILVNDGTPDNSMLIAREYISKKYNHLVEQFIFIDQENQGQSVARNVALKKATGEYIFFLDSDDKIQPRALRKIIEIIDEYAPDVLNFNAKTFGINNIEINFVDDDYFGYLSDEEKYKVFIKNLWMPWLHIFSKKILKNFKFPISYSYEDLMAIPFLYNEVESIYRLQDILVLYRINNTSITAKVDERHLKSLDSAIRIFENNNNNFNEIVLNHCYKMKFKYLCKILGWKEAFLWLTKQSISSNSFDFFSKFTKIYAFSYVFYLFMRSILK